MMKYRLIQPMIKRSRRFRWQIFKAVLVVSLLWIVFCFCVLVFYLDSFEKPFPNAEKNQELSESPADKHGIHVIVGHYLGKGLPWEPTPFLTDDIINENLYSPVQNAGQNGQPVYVPDFEANNMKMLFHINRFNLMASDRISVNRSLPDPRKLKCRSKHYNIKKLGDTSIIIVFHNEAWSTLVRTVHSVINRSPHQLLKEIILVDDASQRAFLGKPLDDYMNNLSHNTSIPIKIMRSSNRTGLIRARLIGANVAEGKVLTFLDAHCEAATGWLEPLLARIADDRTNVVCPIIDIINDQTFAYTRSFELHWGAFNWEMHFRWYPIGQQELIKNRRAADGDETTSFRTPVMAGGLFAIDRNYFFESGSYDPHMNVWGGENIEMSLRIWQCGGRIEIAPCSHVAHLFRRSSPYSFGNKNVAEVLYTNLARVAEVWLDDWKNFFYKLNPVAAQVKQNATDNKLIDISDRIFLKKKLKCKGFEWYLKNIWPEHFFPTKDRFFGRIRSFKSKKCLQRPTPKNGSPSPVGKVELQTCAIEMYSPQNFVYTKQGFVMTDESVCLDVNDSNPSASILLLACSESKRQKWKFEPVNNLLRHLKSKKCLELIGPHEILSLRECSGSSSQRWEFEAVNWQSS